MSNLTPNQQVVCCAGAYTKSLSDYHHLDASARYLGVPLHVLGFGRGYPEIVLVRELCDFLKTRSEPYALVTDAFDAMFCRWDPATLVALIEDQSSGLLISCEADCWPAGAWCDAYGWRGSPWYAINGGQYCGRREDMINLMETIVGGGYTDECGGTWQERMHKMYAAGYPMGLDTQCRVFQSLSGEPQRFVKLHDRRVLNASTLTAPMLLHFNGRTPGIERWFNGVFRDA